MTHEYHATIKWQRQGAAFVDNRYSRGHIWRFDGGVEVPASSAPSSVPLPYSIAAAVDPEEALVAAVSSCHMLFFLSFAAKQGFVVDRYWDEAIGAMDSVFRLYKKGAGARSKLAMGIMTGGLTPHP